VTVVRIEGLLLQLCILSSLSCWYVLIFTDHYSIPNTAAMQDNNISNEMTFDLGIWHAGLAWPYIGKSLLLLQLENVPFLAMYACGKVKWTDYGQGIPEFESVNK